MAMMDGTQGSDMRPSEQDYRQALHAAERALMHAAKWVEPPSIKALAVDALAEVVRVLDMGRDEANEQTGT